MTVDQNIFKAEIEKLPNGSDLLSYHVQAVETEKNRGIEESRKTNAEAANLRKFKIALEKIGYQKDADLDEFVGGLKSATEKATQADQTKMSLEQVTTELNRLKTDFTKTNNDLLAERQAAQEAKASAAKKVLKSKLSEALKDAVYGHDFVADSLINNGQVVLGDNDAVEFMDGQSKLDFQAGLRRLLETRTDIVKNTQRPGANSTAPAGTPGKKFTIEQLQTMSKDDIKANLKDVKASLGITS